MIPDSYIVCDWIGEEDFTMPLWEGGNSNAVVPTSLIRKKFAAFSERLPIARRELEKLVPEINLDHSLQSLEALDLWLPNFLEQYQKENADAFPYAMRGLARDDIIVRIEGIDHVFESTHPNLWRTCIFQGLTPALRSVLSDLYTYFGECLQMRFPDLVWEVNVGRKRDERIRYSGFPSLIGRNPAFSINRGYLGLVLDNIATEMIVGKSVSGFAKSYTNDVETALDFERRGVTLS